MALTITATPGKVFQQGEYVTTAKLNQLGTPVMGIDGTVAPSDMAPADYSGVLQASAYWYGLDTGIVNAAAVTLDPPIPAYLDGLGIAFKVLLQNTGPATLNVNGLGAMAVLKYGNVPLAPGDWIPGEIVLCRYQLDANLIVAATPYSAGGSLVVTVTVGRQYNWTKGANDTNCVVDGITTLTTTGNFTATQPTVTLNGTDSTLVTASLTPVSNVWQMVSPGQAPNRYYRMQGATALKSGIEGLTARPKAGQQNFYLKGDGTFGDAVGTAVAQIAAATAAATGQLNLFNQQTFN